MKTLDISITPEGYELRLNRESVENLYDGIAMIRNRFTTSVVMDQMNADDGQIFTLTVKLTPEALN